MGTEFILFKIILLIFFLVLSAFFSASETALFSLDSIQIRRLTTEGKGSGAVVKLLENPLRCLTTILAGNTLANIAITSIITMLLIHMFGEPGVLISVVATTLVLLAFCEVTPKTIAIHNNERLAYWCAGPLYLFARLISPFIFLASRTVDVTIGLFGLNLKKEPTLTEEEFRSVMEVGHRAGIVAKSEKEMVVSILELTATTAAEVMTPRMDIKAISATWDREKSLAFVRKARHAKLPVYKDNYDNIVGVLHAKELFLETDKAPAELIHPALFVPETKKISELIRDFYKQESKIAIVVDEYGGTSGCVTLDDILEEIFGEMQDEIKPRENLIVSLKEGGYRISGMAPVYKVNEDCGLNIPPGEYETIAGYLLDLAGRIPSEGESISAVGGTFTIEKVAGRRIRSVVLKR